MKDKIYVFGGIGSSKTAEMYHLKQDTWIYLPKLNVTLLNAVAAGVEDLIYVTGHWCSTLFIFSPTLYEYKIIPIQLSKLHKVLIPHESNILVISRNNTLEINPAGEVLKVHAGFTKTWSSGKVVMSQGKYFFSFFTGSIISFDMESGIIQTEAVLANDN